ncbi:MAG TPA: hypothetical protein VNM48_09475 [Chloroflexota bacterium]|nr:hypothetical protein [Chloroflexota bacterium]
MGISTGNFPNVDVLRKALPAEAAAAGGEYSIGVVEYAGVVSEVRYIPEAAITGVATNNKSINIRNRGTDGAGALLPATTTFAAGTNGVAFDFLNLTLIATLASRDVAAGSVLTVQTLVNGTGLALPAGTIEVEVTRD